jgi:hypothetical protein
MHLVAAHCTSAMTSSRECYLDRLYSPAQNLRAPHQGNTFGRSVLRAIPRSLCVRLQTHGRRGTRVGLPSQDLPFRISQKLIGVNAHPGGINTKSGLRTNVFEQKPVFAIVSNDFATNAEQPTLVATGAWAPLSTETLCSSYKQFSQETKLASGPSARDWRDLRTNRFGDTAHPSSRRRTQSPRLGMSRAFSCMPNTIPAHAVSKVRPCSTLRHCLTARTYGSNSDKSWDIPQSICGNQR